MVPPETLVADRYALRSQLGRGAMGTVWLAQDELLKRPVAVKEIDVPPGFTPAERSALEARMLREARAAARLTHPGAVSVFDVVEHHDRPWIVMEYVDAPTLQEQVESSGPLAPALAATVGLALLDVLEAAHSAGIVHRDVKPGNVMCAADGTVKLADFGIASIADDPKLTQTGLLLGSPSFMAPEQATHGTSGPAADLWSLGATLYFAVEGTPPFDEGAAVPTLTAVIGDDPRPMTRAGDLYPVILGLLEKDPAERLTVVAAKPQLEQVAVGAATTVAEPASATPATAIASEPVHRSPRPAAAARARRGAPTRWLPWVALGLGLAALIGVPLLLDRGDDRAPGAERDNTRQEEGTAGGKGDDAEGGGTTTDEDGSAASKEGWTTYTDETVGYSVDHPAAWAIIPRSSEAIDFTDTATGTYLRVAWTDEPGPDVMERLEEISASFAAEHADYAELQMTPTEYQGHEAGLWEYTYTEGGVSLHAYNLQFVINDEYGFALNFQTHEEDWDSSLDLWDQLQASFQPPA